MSDLDFGRGLAFERTRVREILLAPEAVGKERAAIELALNTGLSSEELKRLLRRAQAASPRGVVVNIADGARSCGR